jgi:hypothetical protein
MADGAAEGREVLGAARVDEREVHEDRARPVDRQRLEHLGVARVGHREGLGELGEVLLPEQDHRGVVLPFGRIRILHDAVDDGLRPRRQVERDAVEHEEHDADGREEQELGEGPRGRTGPPDADGSGVDHRRSVSYKGLTHSTSLAKRSQQSRRNSRPVK